MGFTNFTLERCAQECFLVTLCVCCILPLPTWTCLPLGVTSNGVYTREMRARVFPGKVVFVLQLPGTSWCVCPQQRHGERCWRGKPGKRDWICASWPTILEWCKYNMYLTIFKVINTGTQCLYFFLNLFLLFIWIHAYIYYGTSDKVTRTHFTCSCIWAKVITM